MQASQIEPTGGRLLVRKLEREKEAIISLDEEYGGCVRGLVLAVGPGDVSVTGQRVEPRVKAGDEVLYRIAEKDQESVRRRYFATEDMRNLAIITEREIWSIVNK